MLFVRFILICDRRLESSSMTKIFKDGCINSPIKLPLINKKVYMSKHPKISSYFSAQNYNNEKKKLFSNKTLYVGHKLMVQNDNDYHVSNHTFDRFTLFNHENEFNLISNVCPHRQARLLEGSGNKKNITCGLHCWTFKNTGELKAAPHFGDKVDSKLELVNTYEWSGLLFKNKAPICDLKKLKLDKLINFDDYFYSSTESEDYNFNWKTFVEIYLENYHVFTMHPGLKHFVGPTDLEWEFGEDYSIQKVGLGKKFDKSGTETYEDWHEKIRSHYKDELPRYGAIWMFIYPNIMLEWYPNILVVSTIHPTSPRTCTNHVEFYYPKKMYKENQDYFEAEKKAYLETAIEDNEACLLLEKGRESLFQNGEHMEGPIDQFLEAGVKEFYNYLDKELS